MPSDRPASPDPPEPDDSSSRWWRLDRLCAWLRPRNALPLLLSFLCGVALTFLLVSLFSPSARTPASVAPALPPADQNPDLSITLSGGLLGALIEQSVAQGQSPLPLEHIRVDTKTDRLTISGDIAVANQKASGSMDLQPYVQAGKLSMRVLDAEFGPIPIPRGIGQLAERPINSRVAAATNGLPASVIAVSTSAEGLRVLARLDQSKVAPLSRSATPTATATGGK